MIDCVDVFCGVGGLTHGLSAAGVRVKAGVDFDPACRFPYERNNASTRFLLRDVKDLTGREVSDLLGRGRTRLLAGCAPCQTFSTYSRAARPHQCDSRWGLLAEFGRLVREVRPELVTMENVPELAQHDLFARFKEDLHGYSVWHAVIDCSRHGVPQKRKRLVLMASLLGKVQLPATSCQEGATVRAGIGGLPPLAAGQGDPNDPMHVACRLSEKNIARIKASKPGGTWRDWSADLKVDCHRKQSGAYYSSVYGRMEWDRPAPTITTQSFGFGNGRFGHPDQDRAITLREAAILQTFPPDYEFLSAGQKPIFHVLGRLIGNAVPVRLGQVIAEAFRSHVDMALNA